MPAISVRLRAGGVGGAALLAALAVGACAPRAAVPASAAATAAVRPTIVAENGGGDWLDVYLVDEVRDWYLGRLAPGAKTALPLPADAVRSRGTGMVRLAVLAGAERTVRASRDARAVITVPQPVASRREPRGTCAHRPLTGGQPPPP